MARLMTPDEAAEAARAKQAAKVAAVEAKRAARKREREQKRESAKLFAAHCADAAKAYRDDNPGVARDCLGRAITMLEADLVERGEY